MNLKSKLTTIAAIGAISLSLFGSSASAASTATDSANTDLNVVCPVTTGIDVQVNGSFSVNATSGASSYSASLPGGFKVVMDLTCNWSTDFSVDAKIGEFQYQGTAPAGQAQTIPGGVLQLTNGSVSRVGPDHTEVTGGLFPIAIVTGDPKIQQTVFPGLTSTDFDIIEDDTLLFPFIQWASPGVSTATWDGNLVALPTNLADGTYRAPLTVVLTVN